MMSRGFPRKKRKSRWGYEPHLKKESGRYTGLNPAITLVARLWYNLLQGSQ